MTLTLYAYFPKVRLDSLNKGNILRRKGECWTGPDYESGTTGGKIDDSFIGVKIDSDPVFDRPSDYWSGYRGRSLVFSLTKAYLLV